MKLYAALLFNLAVLLGSAIAQDVTEIITRDLFETMLKHRNRFYTYNAFVAAARSFDGFGTTGDLITRKRELVAFFGQTSHETTGGWDNAPDGRYAWGYYFVEEQNNPPAYCDAGWPCAPGKKYYGRGPIQLTHNYNYKQAGDNSAIRRDLINNPELVATDATISFKTTIWFWMTPQGNKPSSHNVIIGRWKPSAADRPAGRVSGYGAITNIINGGVECGKGPHPSSGDRIGFYKRYCDLFGINYGGNLNCRNQKPFNT